MTFVVGSPCVGCKDTECVSVCPVDCFYEGPEFLVIDPDECIDCGLCEPACPVNAIWDEDDVPEEERPFIQLNADLVEHWGLIKREVFIGIWVIISILLSLYMLGTYKFPNESHVVKRSKFNVTLSLIFLCFAIYLSPALLPSGSNSARLLSGFTPPSFYSIYPKANDCPLGFNCFKDFNEGLEFAKEKNKPILLDFTGWACVNCRKIEENVWSKPEIYEILSNDVVIVSLYVDDRKKMSENEQFNFKFNDGTLKKIKTIGDK